MDLLSVKNMSQEIHLSGDVYLATRVQNGSYRIKIGSYVSAPNLVSEITIRSSPPKRMVVIEVFAPEFNLWPVVLAEFGRVGVCLAQFQSQTDGTTFLMEAINYSRFIKLSGELGGDLDPRWPTRAYVTVDDVTIGEVNAYRPEHSQLGCTIVRSTSEQLLEDTIYKAILMGQHVAIRTG
jgi:hypothetical protein